MNEFESEKKKQVIGLYGEMQLAMILHERGWQVHRAYIDEGIDFTITKYWCPKCKKFSNQYLRREEYKGKEKKCVTNLCEHCKKTELSIVSRYLQVKTSEGAKDKEDVREFSFHPKIRYDMGNDVFYVWIAIFEDIAAINDIDTLCNERINLKKCHFYVFNTKDVSEFDNTGLPTYQITDNQKTTLRISSSGKVLNGGTIYKYDCFNDKFYNDFKTLEDI
ncbi:MAG: hypothetical protein LBH98_03775 [Chitinispirillales bacterium]|jgi:hypothetical protein|nr:hypothetical protein [Chitinispirillales bacterium]